MGDVNCAMNKIDFISEINDKAKYFSNFLWGIEFDGEISINNRLRSTYAQFLMDTNEIKFNKKFLNNLNEYFINETLIHELCHWYCYKNNVKDDDGDLEFETEIFKSGSRSTETTYIDNKGEVWLYDQIQWFYCEKCHENREAVRINKSETVNYYGVDEKKIMPKCPICGRDLKYYCEANYGEEWVKYYPRQKLIDMSMKYKIK